MSPVAAIIIIAVVAYAIYQQSHRHEVVGSTRFKLAAIYLVVGVVIGGFNLPRNVAAVVLLTASIALSVAVGIARGRLTRVWQDNIDHRVYVQGTPLTIGLFLGLIAVKFAMGTLAYFTHVSDDGGTGEIIVMIAIMVAIQAEIVWRRAQPLGASHADRDGSPVP